MKGTAKSEMGMVIIQADQCKGCGLCVAACHFGVLRNADHLNSNGYHPATYDGHGCTGCGLCFYTCPEPGAIEVYRVPVRHVSVPRSVAA